MDINNFYKTFFEGKVLRDDDIKKYLHLWGVIKSAEDIAELKELKNRIKKFLPVHLQDKILRWQRKKKT